MSRLLLIALLLLALPWSGCLGLGGDGDELPARDTAPAIDDGVSDADRARPAQDVADPEPTRAALAARPDAALRAQLDAGSVAVVDLVGSIGIRPSKLTFATGGRLEALEWQRWDDRGAEGTGRLEGVVCEPDCARGTRISARATIRLSQPVACPAGRFFDRGAIEVASDDPDADSNSWLAAPC